MIMEKNTVVCPAEQNSECVEETLVLLHAIGDCISLWHSLGRIGSPLYI